MFVVCSKMSSDLEIQNLDSLLSKLCQTNSDSFESLDRENIHFHICDNLITFFEKIKFNHTFNCKFKQLMGQSISHEVNQDVLDENSFGPFSYSSSLDSSIKDGEENESDLEILETISKPSTNPESGLFSLSETMSLSSISDISKNGVERFCELSTSTRLKDDITLEDNSAESVAINLLANFLQNYSCQRKLCDPNSFLCKLDLNDSKDDSLSSFSLKKSISADALFEPRSVKYRGNSEWAPPRPQLIFQIHPPPKKNILFFKQNQRCAGCGTLIDRESRDYYRLLYCHYTGKYFCQNGCFSGKKSVIPANVIFKWDFSLYPVSNFAFNLIEKIAQKHLFNLKNINHNIYKKVKSLNKLHDFRYQLSTLREYIYTCKKAGNIALSFLTFEPKYMIEAEVHNYLLIDLISIKRSNKIIEKVCILIKESISHLSKCVNCKSKGFICEICSKDDILFPFEIGRVYQCSQCKTCYHAACFQIYRTCRKCSRINSRKMKSLDKDKALDEKIEDN